MKKKFMIETLQRYRKRVYYYAKDRDEAVKMFGDKVKPAERDDDYLEDYLTHVMCAEVNEDNQYI